MVRLLLSDDASARLQTVSPPWKSSQIVEHEQLLEISTWARSASGRSVLQDKGLSPEQFRLASLLKDADVHFQSPQKAERSKELDNRLSSIRSAQEADQYAHMLRPRKRSPARYQVPTERATIDEKKELKEAKKHLSAIVNVLASMMAVATAAWWAAGGLGQGAQALSIRVFFSLSCSFFIGGAEAWLYYRHFSRASGSPSKSKRRRSSKQLTRPVMIRAPSARKHERLYLRQRAIANRLKTAPPDKASLIESKKSQ